MSLESRLTTIRSEVRRDFCDGNIRTLQDAWRSAEYIARARELNLVNSNDQLLCILTLQPAASVDHLRAIGNGGNHSIANVVPIGEGLNRGAGDWQDRYQRLVERGDIEQSQFDQAVTRIVQWIRGENLDNANVEVEPAVMRLNNSWNAYVRYIRGEGPADLLQILNGGIIEG